MAEESGFLSRWSRRKNAVVQGVPEAEAKIEVTPLPNKAPTISKPGSTPLSGMADSAVGQRAASDACPHSKISAAETPFPSAAQSTHVSDGKTQSEVNPELSQLSLEDTRFLTKDSDFTPFMSRDVSAAVRNAAMKKLFADPHFNIMDGLDTYIDDYSKFVPLPESVLRQMNGAKFLNLFSEETEADEKNSKLGAVASEEEPLSTELAPGHSQLSVVTDSDSAPPKALSGENFNNLTQQTVAQSYAQPDIAAFAAVVPTTPSQPGLTINPEASQPDHAHTDLRLQPDHAPAAPAAGHGTK